MRRSVKISMIFGFIAANLLTLSCSKSSGDEPTWYEQIYFNITRSSTELSTDTEPTTYNFTLFAGANTSYSGTYRTPINDDEAAVGILFPCAVSSTTGLTTSTSMDIDTSKGLTAPVGSYQMVVVSPAIAVSNLTSDHLEESRVGFKIERHLSSTAVDLFIKEAVSVSVSGVEIDGKKEYSFDENSADLLRPRSKLILYVKSTNDVEHIVENIYLSNVMDIGYYNPTAGYYRETTETITPYSDFFGSDLTVDSDAKLIEVINAHKTTVTSTNDEELDAIYLIANDCSGGEDVYVTVPNLVIDLIRGSESTNSTESSESSRVTIPLQYNFKRSYYYELTINISSTSVTLTGIEVAGWDEVNGGAVDVENLTPIVVSLTEPGDWEEGEGGNTSFN